MLNIQDINADYWLSCFLAVGAAKDCIHIWSDKHPNDDGPNKAIEDVEAWLSNPWEEMPITAVSNAYTYGTRRTPTTHAYASAFAVAVISGKGALNYASDNASFALAVDRPVYINNLLARHLSFIIGYKIGLNQSFGDFEAVFEAASEADKERLLFHFNLSDK